MVDFGDELHFNGLERVRFGNDDVLLFFRLMWNAGSRDGIVTKG